MPSREPTSDAKWCLSSLFQHMEINLRNRVDAKTGRSTSLELNKLSNLMSHAGLAHVSKPRAPWSPTRLKRLEGGITMTPEQRMALREVFIFYCGWAEKGNFMYMTSSQFLRFCRDTFLMTGDLDSVALVLLFNKVQLESPEQAPGARITMVDWLQALMLISLQHSAPGLQPQEAWDKLINDHVLMFGGKVDCSLDRLAPVMLQPDIVEILGQAKPKLRPVFNFYVNDQTISPPQTRQRRPLPSVANTINTLSRPLSPNNVAETQTPQPASIPGFMHGWSSARNSAGHELVAADGAQGVLDGAARRLQGIQTAHSQPPSTTASHRSQSQMIQQARAQMPLPTFLRFLQDFDIMPRLVNKAEATLCFRQARFGPGHDQDEGADLGRIAFAEFMDAVGRCALLAYNFQVKAEPEKLLTFKEGYHQGAKHLWSTEDRDLVQESLAYPDEVAVPAADRDECIGAEDSPHYDERMTSTAGRQDGDTASRWGARSTRSRAGGIFRSAQSLANYHMKQTLVSPSGHVGAEVMAMHDEMNTLDNDRPLHLKPFQPSWIGEPGVPFSETNNLQRRYTDGTLHMGVYTGTGLGLPSVFKQRAEDMIEARIVREQAMEALKLMYATERRNEQREKDRATQVRRQELQQVSGQVVVERPRRHHEHFTSSVLAGLNEW